MPPTQGRSKPAHVGGAFRFTSLLRPWRADLREMRSQAWHLTPRIVELLTSLQDLDAGWVVPCPAPRDWGAATRSIRRRANSRCRCYRCQDLAAVYLGHPVSENQRLPG